MFKKIMSLALALVMIASIAAIAASAAQVEIAGSNADAAAELAADAPADVAADAGAETGASNKITFDPSGTGWKNFKYISFHIWPYDSANGDPFYGWGDKKERGTDNGDGTYSFDLDAKGITLVDGVQYAVIFYNENSMQTYNLLMGTSCIGDTAYCDGTEYENPVDSSKKGLAAFWKNQDASVYGPEKCVTSIGNVVGTCIPQGMSAYKLMVKFLTENLLNARTYAKNDDGSAKTDQQIVDDTATAIGNLKREDVKNAIAEAGSDAAWEESKSSLPEGSDESANQENNNGSGSGSGSGSSSSSGLGSGSSSGSGSSGSGSSSSGSGSNSKTGQDTTMLYIMLGVMILAAGVIVVVRRKERT